MQTIRSHAELSSALLPPLPLTTTGSLIAFKLAQSYISV